MNRSEHSSVRVKHRVVQSTLVIDLGAVHRVLSSAPRSGGLVKARSILNHQVAANPKRSGTICAQRPAGRSDKWFLTPSWSDPARYLGMLASKLGAKSPSVGLMTAVPMKQLVGLREESNGIWVECFCTVGVTNAVRAGEPATFTGSGRRLCEAGTINILLVTNATLSVPAMVGAVQVATESKTAMLKDRKIRSWTGRAGATGTGTDVVAVACPLNGKVRLRYSGTHTTIGSMIGRVVGHCIHEGLLRADRWQAKV